MESDKNTLTSVLTKCQKQLREALRGKFSGFGHERIHAPERQRLIAEVKHKLTENLVVFCQKQLKSNSFFNKD